MTQAERGKLEQEFKEQFEADLPGFARMCTEAGIDVVVFHQDAFGADYQEGEFTLLGRAIKYAGLLGKEVHVIGRNAQTLRTFHRGPQ